MSLWIDVQEKRMEELAKKIEENSSLVAVIREEVTNYKNETVFLEQQVDKLHEQIRMLMEKLKEQERFKRRQNLNVKGLKEKENEVIRTTVISLLSKIAPGVLWNVHDMVDTVHCLVGLSLLKKKKKKS